MSGHPIKLEKGINFIKNFEADELTSTRMSNQVRNERQIELETDVHPDLPPFSFEKSLR